MGLDLIYIKGQTPIDEDEKDGLLIRTISTKQELDEYEQQNIEKAVEWTIKKKNIEYSKILSEVFIKQLHRRMLGDILIHNGFGKDLFTWGGGNKLAETGNIRSIYISALRDADSGNYAPLIKFART